MLGPGLDWRWSQDRDSRGQRISSLARWVLTLSLACDLTQRTRHRGHAGIEELMTVGKSSERAARRRGEMHRAGGDRRVAQTIAARHRLRLSPRPSGSGRAWINGRDVGGTDARYVHLGHSYV